MNYKRLAVSLALPQMAGLVGSFFTASAISSWYADLAKPSFSPPNWIFGPAWILLYVLMGISVYLIWSAYAKASAGQSRKLKITFWLFWIHLCFNGLWSIIFFGLRNPGLAFVNIIIIWLLIIVLIIKFRPINKWASYLLIPYLLWISFAGYLNYSIWTLNQEELIACPMDAKLCSDGSYAGRVAPQCDFALCPKEDLIQVESPGPNQIISSPLIIQGKARGFWFFEASFPIRLYNENRKLLGTAIAQAKSGWMTEDFVPFSAELKFESPETEKGILVFEKDNPSGLTEHADELTMPIMFARQTRKINLYYYNPELDKDQTGNIMCSRAGLTAVERQLAITKTPIQDAVRLLLLGRLTEQEKSQGISTEYPLEGLSLKSALLKDGVLVLEFVDPNNKTSGGSCRAGILWFQIEATVKQFPEVRQVQFLPEDIFQP